MRFIIGVIISGTKTLGCVGWTATLARHGAAKPDRAGRCSGCCKIKPGRQGSFDSSVKIPRLTFHRRLLEGARSASERSRPPKRRARWSLSHLALRSSQAFWLRAKKGCPTASSREFADRGVPWQPACHARAAQRVRGLLTAAQSCRAKLCCAYRCDALRRAVAAAGARHEPALGAANGAQRRRVPQLAAVENISTPHATAAVAAAAASMAPRRLAARARANN